MAALVGVIMEFAFGLGDDATLRSDFADLGVPHEARVLSAHRTPDLAFRYRVSGIARAGGDHCRGGRGGSLARRLCGQDAASVGVLMESASLKGLIRYCRSCKCPAVFPSARWLLACPRVNAALFAAAILAGKHRIPPGGRRETDATGLGPPDPSQPAGELSKDDLQPGRP